MTPEQIKKFIAAVEPNSDGSLRVLWRPRADFPFTESVENIRELNFKKYDYDLAPKFRAFTDADNLNDTIGMTVVKNNDVFLSTIVGDYYSDSLPEKVGFEIKHNKTGNVSRVPFDEALESYQFNSVDYRPLGVKIEGTSIY